MRTQNRIGLSMTPWLCLIIAGSTAEAERSARDHLDIAVKAIRFLRQDSTTMLRGVSKDSLIVDLDGAVPPTDSVAPQTLDSIAGLDDARVALRAYIDCDRNRDADGRAARSACAMQTTPYYGEITSLSASDDSAHVVVAVMSRATPPHRRVGLVRAVENAVERVAGRRQPLPAMTLQTYIVDLVSDGTSWRAVQARLPAKRSR